MQNLIRVSKAKKYNLPFTSGTFYKWFCHKRYPEIFVKFGHSLFVDIDALQKLIDAGRQMDVKENPGATE